MYTPLATYYGKIENDALNFTLNVNGAWVENMILDTGAFELTFNGTTAQNLGLPNLGAIQIGGVGGEVEAYQSVCTLNVGAHVFENVPCIVDPDFSSTGLFGLRFFVDNQLLLVVDPTTQTFTIEQA
ncbi:retropepsin-like aspartic protease [Alicyclobacillus fodiniaquatilis]|uniref:Retropepsin-like aspartic protease n=1 Tax=Alicyclobacillus fodiniaquatilis TaxID=1661150 RepID=A0ABW4JQN5_9BACL